MADADLITVAKEYFKRLDSRSPTLLELFAEDAQIYYPKYGIGKGRNSLLEIALKLRESQESVQHDTESYLYMATGDHVAVEGTTRGVFKSGQRWAGGETPHGRFCNVFQIQGGLIQRLHVYMDPDGQGLNEKGFLWGREGRQW